MTTHPDCGDDDSIEELIRFSVMNYNNSVDPFARREGNNIDERYRRQALVDSQFYQTAAPSNDDTETAPSNDDTESITDGVENPSTVSTFASLPHVPATQQPPSPVSTPPHLTRKKGNCFPVATATVPVVTDVAKKTVEVKETFFGNHG